MVQSLANGNFARFADKTAAAVYLGAMLIFLVLLARNHLQIVTAPTPLDYNEGTMPYITGVIAAGQNPYTYALQPTAADVYPPLYNIVVAPLSWVFGNTLQLHRIVSGLFVVMSCVLAWRATRKAGGSALNCLAAASMLYAALLYYVTPVASTNAIGVFFFLASVLIPWEHGFSPRSLIVSLACGLLAFYSKQYFVVGLAFVSAYLFCAVSMRKAVLFGVATLLGTVGSVVVVQQSSPYFLDNTVFSVANAVRAADSFLYVRNQLVLFAQTYLGILILLLITALRFAPRDRRAAQALMGNFRWRRILAPGGFDAPALRCQPDYFAFCFACSLLVIVALLGRNPGNHMTYLFQLMSPFLLMAAFGARSLQLPAGKLLLPLVFYGFYKVYAILPRDFSVDTDGWRRIDSIVKANQNILASPILVMSLLDNHKYVYQNGHTFYFRLAANKPDFLQPTEEQRRVDTIWNVYVERLYRDVENKRFDCVLVNSWDMKGMFGANPPPGRNTDGLSYFQRYYRLRETIALSMPERPGGGTWEMQVWIPK